MGHHPERFDVVVIGGGPAGATAAALLARGGRTVALIEKEAFPRFRIGESLLPAGMRILRESGALAAVLARGRFLPKQGAEFSSPDGSFTVHNVFANGLVRDSSWALEVERSRFDQILLDHACESGTTLFQPATVRSLSREGEEWFTRVRAASGEEILLRSCWLVDASGRACLAARARKTDREPLPYPKRSAIFGHFEGVPLEPCGRLGNIVIVRRHDGWFWIIPLGPGKTSAGFVTESRNLPPGNEAQTAYFRRLIRETPRLHERLGSFPALDELHCAPDYSYSFAEFAGDGAFSIGDAAAFIDPVFSSGVYLGMAGASEASRIILNHEDPGKLRPLDYARFTRGIKKRIRVMRSLIEAFYDEDGFAVFMNPTERLKLFPAVNAVVAGNTDLPLGVRWRFDLFRLVVQLNRRFHFIPRIDLEGQLDQSESPARSIGTEEPKKLAGC